MTETSPASADFSESRVPLWLTKVWASADRVFGDSGFRKKLRFFRTVLLFKDLSTRDLATLVKKTMEKSYGPGEIVFQEGHLGRAFFVVADGQVEILRRIQVDESPQVVARFEKGDFFGEMVLLDELPRSATCRAVETTRLHILYKDHFDSLCLQSPRAGVSILHALGRLLSARLRRERRSLGTPLVR